MFFDQQSCIRGSVAVFLPLTLLSASCALYAPTSRSPAEWEEVPETFSEGTPLEAPLGKWWHAFGEQELNALVEQALTGNLTLAQARARLEQARAEAVVQGAARVPDLRVEGGASAARQRVPLGDGAETTQTRESYAIGLASAYELDLWGRVRSVAEAAAFQRDASDEDLEAAAISVAAEAVLRWVALVGQRQKLDLLAKQLAANRHVLELTELRFRQSQATAVDVFQQREAVARTQSLVPLEEAREQTLLHEIALLTGRAPRANIAAARRSLPDPGPLPDTGLPVELLARRPDVRAAELRLSSADWRLSAARADRLPTMRLTGVAQYSDQQLSSLFDDWIGSLAASITGPLFDAGRRGAEVDRARAVVDERLAAYRLVVLEAFREVEDALVQERKQTEYAAALSAQLEASRLTYQEALARYRNGLTDFLPVLTAESGMQAAERNLVQAEVDRLRFRVALLRALGGAWPEEPQTTTESSESGASS